MTYALLIVGVGLLALLLCLVTYVQLLYGESLRLRPRELPALEFFKTSLEKELGMATATGVQSFRLIKYSMDLLVAILMLAGVCGGLPISWVAFLKPPSRVLALYPADHFRATPTCSTGGRRAAGQAPFAPLLKAMALAVRPVVFVLEFQESLVGRSDDPNGHEETT